MKQSQQLTKNNSGVSDIFARYVNISKNDPDYRRTESALNELFLETFPLNSSLEQVILKVAAVNQLYNANLFAILPVARNIVSQNADSRLTSADPTVVRDIAIVADKGTTKYLYSFATKYCSRQNPDAFSIYDSYVDKALRHFRDTDGLLDFNNQDLKDYVKFHEIILNFRDKYGLAGKTLKDLDLFLWNFGKVNFPNKH